MCSFRLKILTHQNSIFIIKRYELAHSRYTGCRWNDDAKKQGIQGHYVKTYPVIVCPQY